MEKTRVLIPGGGFGGVYTALESEKRRSGFWVVRRTIVVDFRAEAAP